MDGECWISFVQRVDGFRLIFYDIFGFSYVHVEWNFENLNSTLFQVHYSHEIHLTYMDCIFVARK